MTTAKKLISAAGAAGAGEATYVDDVFSTDVWDGTGADLNINNGIALADGPANGTNLQITGDGSISDVSPLSHSLTSSSSMTTNSSVKKFGSGSMHFPYNATLPTVSAPTDSAPRGSEDFTIEGWIYHSVATGSFRTIYASGYPIQIYVNSRNIIAYASSASGSPSYFVNGLGGPANSLTNNTWAHFAFVKYGNTFTVYVNGIGGSSTTSSTAVAAPTRSVIGGFSTSQYGLVTGSGENAYIDDFRITRGRAVYTANFTPPSSAHSLDSTVTGEGGMVWMKQRSYTDNHYLFDTERGATKAIFPNSDYGPQQTYSEGLKSFNSNGFTVGNQSGVNSSGTDPVSWTFRKQPGFFDVVTYTGDGTDNRDISHNLGATVGCLLLKRTDSTSDWEVYHRGLHASYPQSYTIQLNEQNARYNANTLWGNPEVAPSSTSFRVNNFSNTNGATYVAYLFAHDAQDFGTDSDESIIKCGSYTGNGSSNGPEIDLGFEPQWMMIKDTTSSGHPWQIIDSMRGIVSGGSDSFVKPNASDAESAYDIGSLTATGFKITNNSSWSNTNGNNYIYVAIRRPHKPAEEFAATDLFAMDGAGLNAGAGDQVFESPFPVDAYFTTQPGSNTENYVFDRLRGGGHFLRTNGTNAESNNAYQDQFDHMDGIYTTSAQNYTSWQSWMFRRAPGFFDVVAYTGTGGSTNTINHNLGVVPEMMWIKRTDSSDVWWVYHKDMTGTPHNAYMILSTQAAVSTNNDAAFGNVAPTATQFTVGGFPAGSGSENIAYLFATVPGISKVGSYTGSYGADINVDCGFTSGARFVLVKRTDSTGDWDTDWYLWDSERGIVAGNDPYLLLNENSSQVTSPDYIDPLSSGFTVTSSAPTGLNASGGNYIFYAIA